MQPALRGGWEVKGIFSHNFTLASTWRMVLFPVYTLNGSTLAHDPNFCKGDYLEKRLNGHIYDCHWQILMVLVTERYINNIDVFGPWGKISSLISLLSVESSSTAKHGISCCWWLKSVLLRRKVSYWPFSCLSLPVQVCIGNVVTEEKHNQALSAALCPSFIHHLKGFLSSYKQLMLLSSSAGCYCSV